MTIITSGWAGRVCHAAVSAAATYRGGIFLFPPGRRLVCCLLSGDEVAGLPAFVPTGHHAHQQPVALPRHSLLNNEPLFLHPIYIALPADSHILGFPSFVCCFPPLPTPFISCYPRPLCLHQSIFLAPFPSATIFLHLVSPHHPCLALAPPLSLSRCPISLVASRV